MAISTLELEKALKSLKLALDLEKTDIVRDAAIQRFEFTIELAWKTAKKAMGSSSSASKVVIQEMAQQNLIQSPELWFDFIDGRNLTAHTYKQEVAEKVYLCAKQFEPECERLLENLRKL